MRIAGTLSAVLAGLSWAADHGADVANMSLGVKGGFDKAGSGLFVGIINRVFNQAHRAGNAFDVLLSGVSEVILA